MASGESHDELKRQFETLQSAVLLNTAYISAVAIDSAGLHDLCTALADGADVPHSSDRIKKILKIVRSTTWPEEVSSKSEALEKILSDMVHAFQEGKKESIRQLAPRIHGAYHVLCNSFYDWFAKRSGA